MIARKEIEKLPTPEAWAFGDDEFVGRARMHGDALVLDIYDARRIMAPIKELRPTEITARWACDGKNFATYLMGQGGGSWSERGLLCAAYGAHDVYRIRVNIKMDEESERTVADFVKDKKIPEWRRSAADKLLGLEEDIRWEKREKAAENRANRMYARLEKRKPLPKDWESWLDNHVFPRERYLFYDAKKRKTGVCAHCGAHVGLSGKQRDGGEGKCPACKSRITYRSRGRCNWIREAKQVVYLQRDGEEVMARYFSVWKVSCEKGEHYATVEEVMETYGKRTWRDYNMACTRLRPERWGMEILEDWMDVRPSNMGRWEPEGHLYTRNVRQALKGTRFQYAPLAQWARHERGEIPVGVFLGNFIHSPFLEFFIKLGLYRLTKEYITYPGNHWRGETPREILGLGKDGINQLVRIDGGMAARRWLMRAEEHGEMVTDEELDWLEQNCISPGRSENILKAGVSIRRLVGYVKKQTGDPCDIALSWDDYLAMAEEVGMDTHDDIVRFPKTLRQRHDQLVEEKNRKNEEERLKRYAPLDAKIKERLYQAERYHWKNGDYEMIPATGCGELMAESRTLHHCVGTSGRYMRKMAEGETWILFLRRAEKPEEPYYTIEIDMQNDKILQWYSMYDRQPDKEKIEKVLDSFLKSVKRRKRKKTKKAA